MYECWGEARSGRTPAVPSLPDIGPVSMDTYQSLACEQQADRLVDFVWSFLPCSRLKFVFFSLAVFLDRITLVMPGMCLISSLCLAVSLTSYTLKSM